MTSSRDEDRRERAVEGDAAEAEDHIEPEPLDPEKPAASVEDVIEVFDREPPERPVTDADAQPPFG